MTTKTATATQQAGKLLRFPDYPPRDDMQNWRHLYRKSITTTLMLHFKDKPGVIIANEVPIRFRLPTGGSLRIPDLSVIFDADLELIELQNGYEIIQHGKPPEFVLEVASRTTGVTDYTTKRSDYEGYGILEYWRSDPSGGRFHDAALAGDRLVNGRYRPIAIARVGANQYRGYSEVLGLHLCWEDGELRFYDPAARDYLRTHEEEADRADTAETQAAYEAARAETAETRAILEAARANAAETRAATEAANARREAANAKREAANARRQATRARRQATRARRQATRAETAETRVAELEAELRRLRGE